MYTFRKNEHSLWEHRRDWWGGLPARWNRLAYHPSSVSIYSRGGAGEDLRERSANAPTHFGEEFLILPDSAVRKFTGFDYDYI